MPIEGGGSEPVDDCELTAVAQVDRRGGEELGVERVELLGVLVGPEREPRGAADHLEGVLEGVDDVISCEAIARLPQLRYGSPTIRHGVQD
jgi:hypothetical protein